MIEPLPERIFNRAKTLNISQITLRFSGGDDQGYLNVDLNPYEPLTDSIEEFSNQIEEWAWNVYEYGGAGDGTAYGDTICYDLTKKQVTHTEWHHAPVEKTHLPENLKIQ